MGCGAILVRATLDAIERGENLVEFCFDHFAPATHPNDRPAFLLHVMALNEEDHTAAFALLSCSSAHDSAFFVARWGRAGVGSTLFMPVPAQIEDERPGFRAYGEKISNFTFLSHQWELVSLHDAATHDMPSRHGETIEQPVNIAGAWALRDGLPVANVDDLPMGDDAATGISKEAEPQQAGAAASFRVRFGGRIWRRWVKPERAKENVELLAFDTNSPRLQTQLEDVWEEIGGQEEARRELIRAIQWPVLYPDLFRLFRRQRSKGVLLYGPPGTGKTLLGKAVVRLLAALYQRRPEEGGFQYVRGHELLDMYVGGSEKAVRDLFDRARRWKAEKGYPAVLFFDEADALFRRRPIGAREGAFTLVPALLAEMDGMEDNGAFVMLATNRPDSLDLAVTRPGRIDRRIRVTRPDEAASARIFSIHLNGVFLEADLSMSRLCEQSARALFSAEHKLYNVTWDGGGEVPFLLKDLASGALIHNIVDRATANKMALCIESNMEQGLALSDVEGAIAEMLTEQRFVNHTEELQEFAERHGRGVAEVRRAANV
jgi:hypothetical protein